VNGFPFQVDNVVPQVHHLICLSDAQSDNLLQNMEQRLLKPISYTSSNRTASGSFSNNASSLIKPKTSHICWVYLSYYHGEVLS
jgi:hypothetical protein